jgi:hypothetical protein
VPDRVGGAVEPRVLAEPHPEHAVVPRAGELGGELAPPHRGRPELLVDARLEDDLQLARELALALQFLVQAAERRAGVAGDERRRVEPAAPVGPVLVEGDAHDRLRAGREDLALVEHVLVVERDVRRCDVAGDLDGRGGLRQGALRRIARDRACDAATA